MELRIKVSKDKLLSSLKDNKEKHINDFNIAMTAWKTEVINILFKEYNKLQQKGDYSSFIDRTNDVLNLDQAPISKEADYTEAIEMLEYCSDIEIELQTHQYNAFVKDQWPWKGHWNTLNSKYLTK